MTSTTSILGYCQPLNIRNGESTELKISSNGPTSCSVKILRIICGDIDPAGPGADFEQQDWGEIDDLAVSFQPINAGSYAVTNNAPNLSDATGLELSLYFFPTKPCGPEQVLFHWRHLRLFINPDGLLCARVGTANTTTNQALLERRWYRIDMSVDVKNKRITLECRMLDALAGFVEYEKSTAPLTSVNLPAIYDPLIFAAEYDRQEGERMFTRSHYNGKIEHPILRSAGGENTLAEWNFSQNQMGTQACDCGPNSCHLALVNTPMRAASGHNWNSSVESWQEDPSQYGAIHFHDDDMTDCCWQTSLTLTPPADTRSGFYIARMTSQGIKSDIPFFVSVRPGQAQARLLLIAPTATYMSYANTHIKFDSHNTENLYEAPMAVSEDEQYLNVHREFGLSHYDTHSDESGVIYASERRPMLNFRPGLYTFNYLNDTHISKWLETKGYAYDVATDEDLHRYGRELLDNYQVIMTASHPEYYSTQMWDAVFGYQLDGGRHMYLGGNGFYWRIAYSEEHPGIIENRRGDAGVRTWEGEPGEHHLSFTGEPGGLWRTQGRAPQVLVGNGFSSTLFVKSTWFRRAKASYNSDCDFIFRGVNTEVIGDFGYRGGGCVGLEIDRWDSNLGSPPNSLILATSEYVGAGGLLSGEEFITTTRALDGVQNGRVRADMVLFATSGGGIVWSAGSIAWATSLMWNGAENSVSQITENVLNRFLDPQEFQLRAR